MTALWFVAQWALRSSIMIMLGALLLWTLRVKDVSVRLALWTAILCASLAIPILAAVAPSLPFPTPPAVKLANPAPTPTILHNSPSLFMLPALGTSTKVSPRFNARRIGFVVYLMIAGTLLLRLGVGILFGLRVLRVSGETGRMSGDTEIRDSARVSVPVTLGIVRPAIVLPEDWRSWDETKLEAVLAHERSHVRRKDPLVQAISAIHRALLWPTPLSWFLHRQLVRVAEEASDDAAMATVSDRTSYANVVLGFMGAAARRVAWQGTAMARYGSAEERIHRILNGTTLSRGLTLPKALMIVVLVLPLTYVVAAARPQQAVEKRGMRLPVIIPSAQVADVVRRPSGSIAAAAFVSAAQKPSAEKRTVTATQETKPTQDTSATQAPAATQAPTAAEATTNTGRIGRYVIVNDSSISGSWDSSDDVSLGDLRERFGSHFAWFRQNGHDYLVTDAAVLDELAKAMEPQQNVNRMQADVNREQARVNALQAKVNEHQGEVNGLQQEVNRRQDLVNQIQHAVNGENNAQLIQKLEAELKQLRTSSVEANQASVNRRQAQINEEQNGVNAEQAKVNALQHNVNEEQHRVSAEFSRRMVEIFDSALKRGDVKQLN